MEIKMEIQFGTINHLKHFVKQIMKNKKVLTNWHL